MSDQPSGKPSGDPSQPFARGRIQWGRPPQTVFRVGPLPTATAWSQPAPSPKPKPAPRPDFFSGSMIPQARPAEAVAEVQPETPIETQAQARPAPPPPVEEIDANFEAKANPLTEDAPVAASVEDTIGDEADYDDAVDAEEVVAKPVFRRDEIIIEPEEPDAPVTVPPLMSDAARPAVDPKAMPSVVVTPTLYARMGTAIESVAQPKNRWLLLVGFAAVIVTGAFVWVATLPAGEVGAPLDPDAPTPTAPSLAATSLIETDTVGTPPVAASDTVPAAAPEDVSAGAASPIRTPSMSQGAPATRAPARTRQVQTAPAPEDQIAPAVASPAPAIDTVPLQSPQPTPAAPPPSDPSAPIQTSPQPLG